MTTMSNFMSLFQKMSKIIPSSRSPKKNQPTAVPSSSTSISSNTKEAFNANHTINDSQPTLKKTKRSPSDPSLLFSPLASLSSISVSSSSIKDFHDLDSSLPPIYPWMVTPLPNSTWVFRTGFTPQPASSAISELHWCHHCDMHIQGTVDHRCEHCDRIFLPTPSLSPMPPPKKMSSKWSRSLGRFFSH